MNYYRNRFKRGETLIMLDKVTHITYMADAKTLHIYFVGGTVDGYNNVEQRDYDELLRAVETGGPKYLEHVDEIDKLLGK